MGKVIESDRVAPPPAPTESSPAAPTPERRAGAIANPVLENCADPAVSRVGTRWYMTCTGGRAGNIYPIYVSSNLASWRQVAWVFPGERPVWADGHDWSPELHPTPDGFAAYFTMRVTDARHAIGIATATAVAGPYRDEGAPLIAPREGASDPHVLVEGGRRYLYFKSEQVPPSIHVQALADDGRTIAGDAKPVLVAEPREQDNIEAPWVIREGAYYYLFYSSARYCDPDYSIRVARSRSAFGPFEKRPQPLVAGGATWAAPGHVSITQGPAGERFVVYHAYRVSEGMPSCDGEPGGRRHVRVDRLEFADGWPRVPAKL
ncbi:MAG: family 43 glycosylhydrolase [Deltaproteobacteria bacterium]|nr:family 43 glycosylhydrolase [Deltaproteobacteria bacterium]